MLKSKVYKSLEKRRERNRKYYQTHKLKMVGYRNKYHYNLPVFKYYALLVQQNNSCAICSKPSKLLDRRLDVDHCHTSGKVRGLLCSNCNNLLGRAKDNIGILNKAIVYLRKTQ